MKLVMDEKLKHRLIGLAVVLSLGAIFAPAVMKKSNQQLDHRFSVQVKLPPKPHAPDVLSSDQKELFRTIRIAKVKIPDTSKNAAGPEFVKAESLSAAQSKEQQQSVHLAINEAASHTVKKIIQNVDLQPKKASSKLVAIQQKTEVKAVPVARAQKEVQSLKLANKKLPVAHIAQSSKEIYAVQLASFAQLTNAQALVAKLETKGYKANYIKSSGRSGAIYKVFVGHSSNRPEVMKLKAQLANALQLNGFIVNTRVS